MSCGLIRSRTLAAAVIVAASIDVTQPMVRAQQSGACQPAGELVRLQSIPEASGLTVSRRVPGRLWTHNDSGEPVLFALDERGKVTGQLRVTGAKAEDWEAVAAGRCGTGSCLYIADIGDNNAKRDHITIYRVPEPEAGAESSAQAESFNATYPDGAQDAETLLIAPDGRLHIVTKGSTGAIALYRFPADLQSGATIRLERVGGVMKDKSDRGSNITDGTVSADGQRAVLRSHDALTFFRTSDLLSGRWDSAIRVDLAPLKEPQGEGVALDRNNTLFVAGESGGKGKGGTFASFSCVPRD